MITFTGRLRRFVVLFFVGDIILGEANFISHRYVNFGSWITLQHPSQAEAPDKKNWPRFFRSIPKIYLNYGPPKSPGHQTCGFIRARFPFHFALSNRPPLTLNVLIFSTWTSFQFLAINSRTSISRTVRTKKLNGNSGTRIS